MKEIDRYDIWDGTGSYGDNNEYPTQHKAYMGAIGMAFEKLEKGIEIGGPQTK